MTGRIELRVLPYKVEVLTSALQEVANNRPLPLDQNL